MQLPSKTDHNTIANRRKDNPRSEPVITIRHEFPKYAVGRGEGELGGIELWSKIRYCARSHHTLLLLSPPRSGLDSRHRPLVGSIVTMSSYYNIDNILTDAQVSLPTSTHLLTPTNSSKKVPCTFELEVPNLGYLDNNAGHALKSGTRLDLPLWLAEMLAVSSPNASKTLGE